MQTVLIILYVAAFAGCVYSAIKATVSLLWIPVLLVCIAGLLTVLPLK